jgi:hypothetical protein
MFYQNIANISACLFLLNFSLYAQTQSDLTVLTQDGEKFILFVDGKQINQEPNIQVVATNVGNFKHRIIAKFSTEGIADADDEVKYDKYSISETFVLKDKTKKGKKTYTIKFLQRELSAEGKELEAKRLVAQQAQQAQMMEANAKNLKSMNETNAKAMEVTAEMSTRQTEAMLGHKRNPETVVINQNGGTGTNTNNTGAQIDVPARVGFKKSQIMNEMGSNYTRKTMGDEVVYAFEYQNGLVCYHINSQDICTQTSFITADANTRQSVINALNNKYTVIQNNHTWKAYHSNGAVSNIALTYSGSTYTFTFN